MLSRLLFESFSYVVAVTAAAAPILTNAVSVAAVTIARLVPEDGGEPFPTNCRFLQFLSAACL
jgi:hypothetical protein